MARLKASGRDRRAACRAGTASRVDRTSACSGLLTAPEAAWEGVAAAASNRDDARALPRLQVVGDTGEQAPQLDRGRQLALLLECGTDRGGFCFGNDEHLRSMVKWAGTGKRLVGRSAFQPGSFLVVVRIDLRLIVIWREKPAEYLRRWPPIRVIDLRVMARRARRMISRSTARNPA